MEVFTSGLPGQENGCLITLTTDFGPQSQGLGIMEAMAYRIAPRARFIHLMHGLPPFDITAASRTMETVRWLPTGHHVCVVDPGVGTSRRGLLCRVARGDFLIGPDNGVLVQAGRMLGGITAAYEITNPKYLITPISPLFHGRDVFVPVAAHLANGVPEASFGAQIDGHTLVPAPYEEAVYASGVVRSTAIHINQFGSVHVNIRHEQWDSFGVLLNAAIPIIVGRAGTVLARFCRTFGEVEPGGVLVAKDDYGRLVLAINRGSFASTFAVTNGDPIDFAVGQRLL